MALIWMDGFDHYGDDETKMTEGVYDSVDSEFSLTSTNPRTGTYALRRSNVSSDSYAVKDTGSSNTDLACGVALYVSSLPINSNSYPIMFFRDENNIDQILFSIQPDGSIDIRIGNISGPIIGSSSAGVIDSGNYNHIEFASIADNGEFVDIIFFSERFGSGNLDSYTFKDDLSPPLTGGSKSDFSIVNDDFGPSIKIGTGPSNSHIGLYRQIDSDGDSFPLTNIEFKFKITTLNSGDNGVLSLRDENFDVVFGFGCARDSSVDANQAPNVVFVDQPGQPGNPIGTNSVSLNEWYRTIVTYDEANALFLCQIFLVSDGSLFASKSINATSLTQLKYLVFENDNVTSDPAGVCQFDDIIISSEISESNGICELRVNGVTEISKSNARTTFTEDRNYRYVAIAGGSASPHGVVTYFDDFYIWNTSGSWNNSFIGDRRCYLLRPNQDTNISDFEPSSGSFGYKMIDDESPDDDSSYIIAEAYLQSGSPLTGASEFEIEDLPRGVSLISGINVVSRASKTDSTSAEIFTSINSGADSLSANPHILTTSYRYYSDIYEYDPETISPMTREIFNAASVSLTADDLDPGVAFESPEDFESPTDVTDPFFANVVSLLHFNGLDASTTFTDEIGPVWTAFANAQLDTAFPKFGTAAGLFDGSGDYIRTPDSADWSFGSGDFTIEYQIRLAALPVASQFMGIDGHWGSTVSPTTQRSWALTVANLSGVQKIQFSWSTSGSNQINHRVDWNPSVNTCFHIAITRDGNNIRTFVDGVQTGSTTATSDTFFNSTNPRVIGATANNAGATVVVQEFNGHIDEARITKGIARYTANFTPPSSEFPDS